MNKNKKKKKLDKRNVRKSDFDRSLGHSCCAKPEIFEANGWIPEANSGKVGPMIWEENISSAISRALATGICFRKVRKGVKCIYKGEKWNINIKKGLFFEYQNCFRVLWSFCCALLIIFFS